MSNLKFQISNIKWQLLLCCLLISLLTDTSAGYEIYTTAEDKHSAENIEYSRAYAAGMRKLCSRRILGNDRKACRLVSAQ